MSRVKIFVVAAALLVGALTGLLASSLAAADTNTQNEARPIDVVRELGLPAVDPNDPSCHWGIDVEGAVYCVDRVAKSQTEALAVAGMIRGAPDPSPEQLAINEAQAELVQAKGELVAAQETGDDAGIEAARGHVREATIALQKALEASAAAG